MSDQAWKTSLRMYRERIRASFPIDYVLPALRPPLTYAEYSRVGKKHNSTERADELIQILLIKDERSFEQFCDVLVEKDLLHWASRLREVTAEWFDLKEKALLVLKEWVEEMKSECPVLGILVVGETGTGKSTLVNNLLQEDVVRLGHTLQSETATVSKQTTTVEGVPVAVYDTPGLGDTKCDQDEPYLREMKQILHSGKIHLVIYCLKLTETRMRESLIRTFQEYNKIGVKWEHTVIALTFADSLKASKNEREKPHFTLDRYFNNRVAEWRDKIASTLQNSVHVTPKVANEIRCFPTQDDPDVKLLNGEGWYVAFWLHIFDLLSPGAAMQMMEMSVGHMESDSTPVIPVTQSPGINIAPGSCVSPIHSSSGPTARARANGHKTKPVTDNGTSHARRLMQLNRQHQETLMKSFTNKVLSHATGGVGAGAVVGVGAAGLIGGIVGMLGGPLGSLVGASTGAAIGVAVGSVVGGAIGSVVGFFKGLFSTGKKK